MRSKLLSLLAVIAVSMLTSLLFLQHQSLWTDEMTQMSGLQLDWNSMIHWLIHHEPDLGVPADRMPPGSYIVGKLWGYVAGSDAVAQRVLGMVFVASAAGLFFMTLLRHYGLRSATIGGLLFALSPHVTVMSVEIRAYPLFLLLSVVSFASYMRVWQEGRGLVMLVIALTLSCWTHFFGVVMAWAMLMPLLARWWQDKSIRKRIFGAGTTFLLMSTALIPFVRGAVNLSQQASTRTGGETIRQLVRLAYRTIAHAAIGINPIMLIVALLAVALLGVLSWRQRNRLDALFWAPVSCLFCGGAAIVIATVVLNGFNAASLSYNLWMVPPFLALCTAGASFGRLGRTAGVALVVAYAFGAVQLAQHGEHFAHGNYEQMAKAIGQVDENTAIVYTSDSDQAGMAYFALSYLVSKDLQQFQLGVDGVLRKIGSGEEVNRRSWSRKYSRVFAITARALGHRELINAIDSGIEISPAENLFGLAPGESRNYFAWTALQVTAYGSARLAED